MAHDPLVEKFREYRQWRAKVARAKGRNEKDKVEYLKKHRPEYSLIHLVKERYPTFTDALRDLDDAVTMINLFAIMPIQVAKAKPGTKFWWRLPA
jgi:pescadillo protein